MYYFKIISKCGVGVFGVRVSVLTLIISILLALSTSSVNAKVANISVNDLVEYNSLPKYKKEMISYALSLSKKGYPYVFGKESPEEGGFDCSGAIFHTLKVGNISNVPRTASAQYSWIWKTSGITSVSSSKLSSFEFSKLKPCDLLFWSGTYNVKRDPPISHVMIYLGKLKKNGKMIMVGASNGRKYNGVSQNGYRVFDFYLPKAKSSSIFIGYGRIPYIEKYSLKFTPNNFHKKKRTDSFASYKKTNKHNKKDREGKVFRSFPKKPPRPVNISSRSGKPVLPTLKRVARKPNYYVSKDSYDTKNKGVYINPDSKSYKPFYRMLDQNTPSYSRSHTNNRKVLVK